MYKTASNQEVIDIRSMCVREFSEMRAVPNLSNDIVYSFKKLDGTNFDYDDIKHFENILGDIWGKRGSNGLDVIYQRRVNNPLLPLIEKNEITGNAFDYIRWSVVSDEMFQLAQSQFLTKNIVYTKTP